MNFVTASHFAAKNAHETLKTGAKEPVIFILMKGGLTTVVLQASGCLELPVCNSGRLIVCRII
jgi:hypothetical protein